MASGPMVTTGDVMMSEAKYVISFVSMLLTAIQSRTQSCNAIRPVRVALRPRIRFLLYPHLTIEVT